MGYAIAFSVVALVILFVVFLRVRLDLIIKDGYAVKLRILFFDLVILDDMEETRPKKRHYTKKAIKKQHDNIIGSVIRQEVVNSAIADRQSFKPTLAEDVEALLSLLSSFFSNFLFPLVKNSRVRFKYFRLTVATSDPAETALLYAALSQSVAYLLDLITKNAKISDRQLKKVSLNCNFLDETTSFEVYATSSFSIWKLMALIARNAAEQQ